MNLVRRFKRGEEVGVCERFCIKWRKKMDVEIDRNRPCIASLCVRTIRSAAFSLRTSNCNLFLNFHFNWRQIISPSIWLYRKSRRVLSVTHSLWEAQHIRGLRVLWWAIWVFFLLFYSKANSEARENANSSAHKNAARTRRILALEKRTHWGAEIADAESAILLVESIFLSHRIDFSEWYVPIKLYNC